MDLPGLILDFLLVFLGLGLILGGLGVVLLANPIYSAFSLGLVPHQSIPNLVVKLYCGDDTVGEVLRKNSSTLG